MKAFESHLSDEVNDVVEEIFDEKCIVLSDKNASYLNIAKYIEVHVTEKPTKETTVKSLSCVYIGIINAKRTLLGIYHEIKGKNLQLYIDEFAINLTADTLETYSLIDLQ